MMKPLSPLIFCLLCTAPLAQSLHSFDKLSQDVRPHVIELFTSQGCSSCPPAEAWLNAFGAEPDLWRHYFPLAFHVTYWDYLGWQDPFGNRAFSRRQYEHLERLHSRQVYTPQFVIDGREWRGWFGGDRALPRARGEKVGRLRLSIDGDELRASFTPTPTATLDSTHGPEYSLQLALVGSGFITRVERGENSHKRLQQDFIVLSYTRLAPAAGGNRFHARLQPELFAIPKIAAAGRLAWVAWIEADGRPLQAVADWLE
ncbi:DUF1223 domain-containing protein [Shewanella salipaludis]|nr:DUF1223 domain-containing protein [Shewanella salipaludis]